jgi:hypothetical protein
MILIRGAVPREFFSVNIRSEQQMVRIFFFGADAP